MTGIEISVPSTVVRRSLLSQATAARGTKVTWSNASVLARLVTPRPAPWNRSLYNEGGSRLRARRLASSKPSKSACLARASFTS